jgi:hypothetical protein
MSVLLCLIAKMSDQFLEQRINIKFCVKKSSVSKWHKWFKEGLQEVKTMLITFFDIKGTVDL